MRDHSILVSSVAPPVGGPLLMVLLVLALLIGACSQMKAMPDGW